jgi:hypothetical protein
LAEDGSELWSSYKTETEDPGNTSPRTHRKWEADLCPNLKWVKQQNKWRNICRFALPSGVGRTETFCTKTVWRRSMPKQQRHPTGNLLRKTMGPVRRSGATHSALGTLWNGQQLP